MKYANHVGVFAAVVMLCTAFMPWLYIESKDITVTGLSSEGTGFGKPAMVNLIMSLAAAVFFLTERIWAKRANFFVCGINMAWAIRNYLLMNICYAGECPEMKYGLFVSLGAAAVMLICSLMPDIKLPVRGEEK